MRLRPVLVAGALAAVLVGWGVLRWWTAPPEREVTPFGPIVTPAPTPAAGAATPGAAAPGATPGGAAPPGTRTPRGGESFVPSAMPTPAPGLDAALARDYRMALERQGIRVVALTIVDRRGAGGARVAEVAFQPRASGSLEALRPELGRILGAAASPRLALDQVTVRAVGPGGRVITTVSVSITVIDRWLRGEMSDDAFAREWTVRPAAGRAPAVR